MVKHMPYIEQCEDGYGVTWTKTEHYTSDNEDEEDAACEEEEEQGED